MQLAGSPVGVGRVARATVVKRCDPLCDIHNGKETQ